MAEAFFLGIDLGGTRVRAGVVSEGRLLGRSVGPSRAAEGPEAVLKQIRAVAAEALSAAGIRRDELSALGLAAPGPLDYRRGVILNPPNLPGWDGVGVADILVESFGVPVFLENDANAAAYAEAVYGTGRGVSSLFYVTVSTGIGAGLVLDGRLYRGADGGAGELGQIVVDPAGRPCFAGRRGCLEAEASGRAMVERAREIWPERAWGGAEEVVALAASEPRAREIVTAAARWVGLSLGNVANLLNPAVIAIGGGVSGAGEIWWKPMREMLDRVTIPSARRGLRVERTALGDDGGILGAARLAAERLEGRE